jgi:hypothetical protein
MRLVAVARRGLLSLHIAARGRQIGDEAKDQDRQGQRDGSIAEAEPADNLGLAQPIGERGSQGSSGDVSEQKAKIAFQPNRA